MRSLSYGLEYENPTKQIDAFLEFCSTVFNNISNDALHFSLFPFALKDNAKA